MSGSGTDYRKLCVDLLHAESEAEVTRLLETASLN